MSAWAGYANDATPDRRSWGARTLARRIRNLGRAPHGAIIVTTDQLAMMSPIELTETCKMLGNYELLVLDIAGPMADWLAPKVFALLSSRHWSAKHERATLVMRGGSIGSGEFADEIMRMVRTPAPVREPVTDRPKASSLDPAAVFDMTCFVCGKTIKARHSTSRGWICRDCRLAAIDNGTEDDDA